MSDQSRNQLVRRIRLTLRMNSVIGEQVNTAKGSKIPTIWVPAESLDGGCVGALAVLPTNYLVSV